MTKLKKILRAKNFNTWDKNAKSFKGDENKNKVLDVQKVNVAESSRKNGFVK